MQRSLWTTLALLLLLASAASPATPATIAGIDRFLSATYTGAGPGAAVLVMKDGEVLLRKGYGMADLELGVPMAPDMVFEVGSITKTFTAAAVLLLAERGRLSLDDDVTRHLPGFPAQGRKITIEHLLTHTSGIPNYTFLPDWVDRQRQDLGVEELIGLFRGKPLGFAPGERFSYSNSGYVLLGAILEKVSGRPYEQLIEEEIFAPLGMASSRYRRESEVVPRRVPGYEDHIAEGWRNAPPKGMNMLYAAGDLLSTLDDLARWDSALAGGKLLSKASLERMATPFRLSTGQPSRYGCGWSVGELAGRKVLEHGGATFGFMAHLLRIPEERLLVVVLSNDPATPPRPETVALRVAARALGAPLEEIPTVALTATELEDYAGGYRAGPREVRMVTREGDRLFVQRVGIRRAEAVATARDELLLTDNYSRLRFLRDARGRVTAMEVTPRGGPADVLQRAEAPYPGSRPIVKAAPALFDGYTGSYQLAPGAVLVVTREGDRLFLQLAAQSKGELLPVSETEFYLEEADARFVFVRGAGGRADRVVFVQGGRELPAPRVP